MSFFCDFCGVVVTDVWVECGDEHEGSLEVFMYALCIGFDSCETVF